VDVSASTGVTHMWALLSNGIYRTNRAYGSGNMSPIGLVGHICSRCDLAPIHRDADTPS
jgi:hypothetical protein